MSSSYCFFAINIHSSDLPFLTSDSFVLLWCPKIPPHYGVSTSCLIFPFLLATEISFLVLISPASCKWHCFRITSSLVHYDCQELGRLWDIFFFTLLTCWQVICPPAVQWFMVFCSYCCCLWHLFNSSYFIGLGTWALNSREDIDASWHLACFLSACFPLVIWQRMLIW